MRFYSTQNLFFADTRMDLSNTATQEETLLTPTNQQMVVGQNLQLPPNHLFGDNSQLVVGVSPHTPWLAAIKEQNAQLVTDKVLPIAYSPAKWGEETRQTTVVPTTTGSWEETSGSKGKQQMVLSKLNQLKPEGAFGDSSELVVVQSPLDTLLVTVEEEKAEMVTGRQRGRAP